MNLVFRSIGVWKKRISVSKAKLSCPQFNWLKPPSLFHEKGRNKLTSPWQWYLKRCRNRTNTELVLAVFCIRLLLKIWRNLLKSEEEEKLNECLCRYHLVGEWEDARKGTFNIWTAAHLIRSQERLYSCITAAVTIYTGLPSFNFPSRNTICCGTFREREPLPTLVISCVIAATTGIITEASVSQNRFLFLMIFGFGLAQNMLTFWHLKNMRFVQHPHPGKLNLIDYQTKILALAAATSSTHRPFATHHSESNIKSAFDTLEPGLVVGD